MPWKPPPQPKCARCEKTVYPTEQLKCLDKLWHKGCFNCEICHIKLSMSTYRGYDHKPYCKTHYPTQTATQVAETPESMRLKKQTERQSVVAYTKAFEKEKGRYQGSAEDKGIRSAMNSQAKATNLGYKSTPEAPTPVAAAPAPSSTTPTEAAAPAAPAPVQQEQEDTSAPAEEEVAAAPAAKVEEEDYVAQYDYDAADDDECSVKEGDVITAVTIVDDGWVTGTNSRTGEAGMIPSNYVVKQSEAPPAAAAAPEEVADAPEEVADAPEEQVVDTTPEEPVETPAAAPPAPAGDSGEQWKALFDYEAADDDEVGMTEGDILTNVEVIDDGWVNATNTSTGKTGMCPSNYIEKVGGGDAAPAAPEAPAGDKWVALYDYEASDGDEVSFSEGDAIIDVEVIDDGWVNCTVEKTGARGMAPSNYIEKQ